LPGPGVSFAAAEDVHRHRADSAQADQAATAASSPAPGIFRREVTFFVDRLHKEIGMRNLKATGVFLAIFAILSLTGCSGGMNQLTPDPQTHTANVFTVGTDAPLPSVVSCDVTITGVTLFDGTNNIPVMTDTPQDIDFARLSGLHQLMDLNAVPTGTYYSATVTLSTAVIGYLDTSVTPPAAGSI
jgi:hypothetical protein